MNKSLKKMLPSVFFLCLSMFALTTSAAFAQQGVVRMLYTVPNNTFIENPSGDSGVVTINDTSGSISTLQTSINNARSANPNSIIVINLKRGATYTVSSAGLVLGSHECLVGSDALIRAADASVTVPLITIASGASNVSIAGGTLDGNGANINGINATSAARVNVDKVVVRNCGLDCILLYGNGNTTYDNEMTVTRCDASGSAAHAGISIHNSTQTAVLDNNCHDSAAGIYITAAWANVANNTCENNTTGIDVAGGNDNVVANNTCNNNGTGIHAGASNGMIVGNAVSANTTAGISSTGSGNNFLYNSFGADGANAANFSTGGSGNLIAYKTALSASGLNYFYPPLIDNQHSTTIENGMGRTDLTISSTSIANVQSQYNSALSANPNNVIVLHLNGTFTVGSLPLTLQSDTCVLLNGTIQINSSTTASAAISAATSATRISISGGTIDGGNLTGNNGIAMTNGNSMFCIDSVTIQNFGDNSTSQPGSDAIHISGGSLASMVTRCTINKSGSRGIWSGSTSSHKILYEDNYVTLTRAGIDCDFHTFGAVCLFNTLVGNTYGLWYEQGAQHNTGIGNVVTNSARDNLDAGNLNQSQITEYNNFICNVAGLGGNGLINSAGSDGATFTSHNFFFDNVILNASISSDDTGTQNYYSQNYHSGGSFTPGPAASYFNSTDVDGNLQILDSNSGLAVTVQGASTSDGAPIVTDVAASQGNGSGNDEWQFVPTGAGFYKILNKNSGLAMVVQGAATTNGAPIVQFTYSSGTTYNDEWLIQPAGNGLYNFVNRLSGLYLDVKGASQTPGTQLDQWPSNGGANQQFALVEDAPATAMPDFTIVATPGSRSVNAGSGTTYTATITATNGFNGTVTFSVSGLPAGATGSFSPTSVTGSGSTTLTVSTAVSTPAGSYTLTITGTSGGLVHSDTVTLNVMDFTISATPSSQSVNAGSSANYTVNLGTVNGFNSTVTLAASGLPSGAAASFSPASLAPPGSSTMTVTTSGSTPAANSTLTITGTAGSLAHSTSVTLGVTDFSMAVSPGSRTITAGSNTTYTLTVTALNGFGGTVTFGTVTGLPAGAGASFSPGSVSGSGTSTLTITTSTTTPAGTNTLTIPASSGGLAHNVSATLIVNASSGGALPAGWTDQDIGAVGIAGSASYNGGTFTVAGSGSDIWNAGDQFNFAYQSVTSDTTVIARVAGENGSASYAKAGVMIRETTATNAIEASVLITPTNGVAMEIRPTTGATSINVVGWVTGVLPPRWVKLVRSGNTFTASYSANGSSWTQLASTNVTMASTAKAGLAVTSHDNTSLNTATFDNVSITPPATLSPIADAFVRDGTYATTNFGTATNLDIKNSSTGYNRIAFLKFGLTNISTISSAKLRLYGTFINTNGTSAVTAHQQTNNTWTETGIVWNNMPAAGAAITTVNVSTTTQYWEWDVTSYVQSQKNGGATQVSFEMQNDVSTPQVAEFNSREAPANNPQLVITP